MFNLVEGRRKYFIFSGMLIGLGIAAMIVSWVTTGAVFPLGVDFRGGTRFELQFTQPVGEADIEAVFTQFELTNVSVIALRGEGLTNAWQIRTPFVSPEQSQLILDTLAQETSPLLPETTSVQSVSPSVGGEVTRAAFIAIFVAAVVILVYIMITFRQVPNSFRYGASAVAAMVHDLFIIFGFAAVTGMVLGWEVDALFLTAVLTVAGFSLQDTIVVFDRIRENIVKRPLESQIRFAINHGGQIKVASGGLTEDVIAKLPDNIDPIQVLGGTRSPISLRMFVDGEMVFMETYEPRGLRHEGSVYAVENWWLTAGQHQVKIELMDDETTWRIVFDDEIITAETQVVNLLFDAGQGVFLEQE